MTGLDLARRYWEEEVRPAVERDAPDLVGRIAAGLVGPGSECFGFDDEISRDHDWGPRVYLWIPDAVSRTDCERLRRIYESLPRDFDGVPAVRRLDTRAPRDGVISIEAFFGMHLGTTEPPRTIRDWLVTPEEALSLCTNGEVFADPHGEFTAVRNALLAYFPLDVWLKKIASRVKTLGRVAEYDLGRATRRGDAVLAHYYVGVVAREIAVLGYLLARTYRPYPKWLFHGLRGLDPELGALTAAFVAGGADTHRRGQALVGAVSRRLDRLEATFGDTAPAAAQDRYLIDRAATIEQRITDDDLRERIDSID